MTTQKTLQNTLQFGTQTIPTSQLFISRKYVYAMVNLRPLTQGHILVCPRRNTAKLSDLGELETIELWCTIQEVSRILSDIYKVKHKNPINITDCQISIQNGPEAGQSVNHVHCHIIPKIKSLKSPDSSDRTDRTQEDMAQEALKYRPYFEQSYI